VLRRLLAGPVRSALVGAALVGVVTGAASAVLDTPYALVVGLAAGAPLLNRHYLVETGGETDQEPAWREGAAVNAALGAVAALLLGVAATVVASEAGATGGLLVAVAAGAAVLGGNAAVLLLGVT